MNYTMILAIILFVLMYVLIFSMPNEKHWIALSVATIFVVIGILPLREVLPSIDFNVLMMITGIMGTVNLFIESKMPNKISDFIINKSPNIKVMTVLLAIAAALISSFVDNVATVLMIAPVALTIAKKLHVNPVPLLISISIFSNLEGAATLVGDTTSILLAGAAKMNFLDFFWYKGKMGLFFIIQIGTLLAAAYLYYKLRHDNEKVDSYEKTQIEDKFPTILLCGTMLLLILASFIQDKPENTNGYICMAFFIIGLLREIIKNKNFELVKRQIKEIDYQTLILLASIFVVIGGISYAGVIEEISEIFTHIGSNLFILYTCIVFFSVFISTFIDNIPYVATMLPIIAMLSTKLGIDPTVLYYGLVVGGTLGGNLSPVGASANITSIGILNKNGYKVSFKDYVSYSIPITFIAVITGYVLVAIEFYSTLF